MKLGSFSSTTGGTGMAAGVGTMSGEGAAQAERHAAAMASAPSAERSRIQGVVMANSIAPESMEFLDGLLPAQSLASTFSRNRAAFF